MTKLKGLLLTEGMHGMISQVEGLAKALDLDFIHEKIELNNFWKLFPPKATPIQDFVFKNKINSHFDIVISCGRKSVIPSIYLKQKYKNKILNIHIQEPKVSLNNFDFIVAPAHDGLTGKNVLTSKGAIHYLTNNELDENENYLKNKIDSQLTLLTEKKSSTIDKISTTEQDIGKYFKQEEDILFNKELEEDVVELQVDMSNLSSLIDNISNDISTVNGNVKVEENNKNNILSAIKEVEDLEIKYKAYEFYLNAVKRDGVPYELISKAIPTVEGAVNEILAQIVEFSVMLEMDGKNINCYIVYDDDNIWPLELTSGMEKFISSLAIRVGLINVCNIPSTNFLAIDEGFGNMDSENLNSVYNLFQYLKSQFQFTMIVSHIEGMRDAVDTLLELKKDSGFSKIRHV